MVYWIDHWNYLYTTPDLPKDGIVNGVNPNGIVHGAVAVGHKCGRTMGSKLKIYSPME